MGTLPKSDSAFERLRHDILNGVHAPGAPLRISTLGRIYEVSATPLREALSRLEEKRLVVASPNRGWRVAPVSLEELEDLEASRFTIESSLLRDAMARGGLDWEAGIVAAHHRLAHTPLPIGLTDPEQRSAWNLAHDAFHLALLSAGKSNWLKRFHAETTEQLRRHHQALLLHPRAIDPTGPDTHSSRSQDLLRDALSKTRHTTLMEAVLDRDTDTAIHLLQLHVQATIDVHRSVLKQIVRAEPQP